MRTISLTQGKAALVSDCDYEWLSQWKWIAQRDRSTWYAQRIITQDDGRPGWLRMQNVILPPPEGRLVDHENQDGLDNRRANLRIATRSQNNANQRRRKDNTSGYKGVVWHKRERRWQAQIQVEGKCLYLGGFDDPKDAAQAYNVAAFTHFGEFARLNEIS